MIVGSSSASPNGASSGASYVVFGKSDGTTVELSDLQNSAPESGGFVINGVAEDDNSGSSVSSAGDVNGDGLDDLIIGAFGADSNGKSAAGSSYVVFGKTDTAAIELSDLQDSGAEGGGFIINGIAYDDNAGWSVSSAGDVNGDGFDDLIVGARFADPHGEGSGTSYVIFGGDFSGLATQVGTQAANTLIGTAAPDRLIAGDGDDTLVGNGGADVLRGGRGDDILAVSDLDFARIDGGNGTDTLRLDGIGLALNLITFDNTTLSGLEQIDLGSRSNSLTLNALELLRLSDHSNTLRVFGDATDTVTLKDSGWVKGIFLGGFSSYTNGNATIEVQQGVVITLPVRLPAVELSAIALDANIGGFVINGGAAYNRSGYSVSSAGDVNGDGFDDVIVGAPYDDPNGNYGSGASFVVFGKSDGTAVELSAIEASDNQGGFVINGASVGDRSGWSVSSAGDVNGDSFDDLIIGALLDKPNGNVGSGASFVVFGKSDGTAIELSAIEASDNQGGFVINGV